MSHKREGSIERIAGEVKGSRRFYMKLKTFPLLIVVFLYIFLGASPVFSENIPNPETFFGHKPGADFKLIRWEKIHEYFDILGKNSDRILVHELGKTTMGNPFLLAVFSSPENLSQLDKYKDIAKKLAKGRITEETVLYTSPCKFLK